MKIIIITLTLLLLALFSFRERKSSDHKLFKNQKSVVIVTGATGTLGTEIVRQLHCKCTVVAIGRDQQKLEQLKQSYQCITYQYDFEKCENLQNDFLVFFERQNIDINNIQIIFSNHGSGVMKPLSDFSDQEISAYQNVNLTSHLLLVKFAKSHNIRVLLTGSCIGYVSNKDYELYHLCKQGLITIAKSYKVQIINLQTIRNSDFFSKMPPRTGLRKFGNLKLFSSDPQQIVKEMMSVLSGTRIVNNYGIVTKLSWIVSKMK